MSIDLSLDRLKKLLPRLPYTRPTLHIAGTNGKGSVSALLTSILMASTPPLRVGRFNSPHLISVLDCITINDVDITDVIYRWVRKEVEDLDRDQRTELTGFEVLAMTALRIFETEQVDIVVLEVGMGGRLDATNVIPSSCVLVSALTAVDLDHQAFLGDTVSLIAREKASIARENKPFILGRQVHSEVEEAVEEAVKKVGGTLVRACAIDILEHPKTEWSLLDDTSNDGPPARTIKFLSQAFRTSIQARFPLLGEHQLDNLGTALSVIESLLTFKYPDPEVHALNLKQRITNETVAVGIANVKWRGRLSFHLISVPRNSGPSTSLLVLADGAHNPASAKTLGKYITSLLDQTAETLNPSPDNTDICIPITYLLSLSHSPPKTPIQTLSPILPPSLSPFPGVSSRGRLSLKPRASIALLPFSSPDGMPWVKPVALQSMREAVRTLVPNLADEDLWVAPERRSEGSVDAHGNGNKFLCEALKWAAERHGERPGLVVLAGSLYLVADFYRLLQSGFENC